MKGKIINVLRNSFRQFIVLAFVITILTIIGFRGMQLINRNSFNDPLIETAEYVEELLIQGQDPAFLSESAPVEIDKSLGTFLSIYNNEFELVSSNALIDEETPVVPEDVLKEAEEKGLTAITFQPQDDVRLATVIKEYDDGYILVGKSLRLVEERSENLLTYTAIGWAAALLGTEGLLLFLQNVSFRSIKFKRKISLVNKVDVEEDPHNT